VSHYPPPFPVLDSRLFPFSKEEIGLAVGFFNEEPMPPSTRKQQHLKNAAKIRLGRAAKSQAQRNIEFQTLPSEISDHVVEDTTQDSGSSQSQSNYSEAYRNRNRSTSRPPDKRSNVPTDPEEKKEYIKQQRRERIANETPLQADIRREKHNANERQRMTRNRREETEEEKEDRLAKQREAVNKTRQRLPPEFQMAWEDPDVSRRLLHRLTKPIISGTNLRIHDPDTQVHIKNLFKPITAEEKQSQIDKLRTATDRHSIIYGCAACGIRVIPFGHSKVNRMPLKNLQNLFQYDAPSQSDENPSEEDKQDEMETIYRQKPGSTALEMKIDTRSQTGCFTRVQLALCPQYMERIQKSYSSESKALLCDNCCRCVIQKRQPPLCFKTWDLGDVKSLPKLSLLETLLIQRIRPFTHLAKLVDGKGKFALSGHCMAIPTDAAELVAQRMSMDEKDNLIFPRRVTFDNCGLSVVFVGTMDKWQRILEGTGPNSFYLTTLYKHVFDVQWDRIIQWLQFLKENSPSYADIHIASHDRGLQSQLETLPTDLCHPSNLHSADSSLIARVEEISRSNQLGAPQMDVILGPNQLAMSDTHATNEIVEGRFASTLLEPSSIHLSVDPMEEGKNQFQSIYNKFQKDKNKNKNNKRNSPGASAQAQAPMPTIATAASSSSSSVPPPPNSSSSPVNIGHDDNLVNEFTQMRMLMSSAFPTLFPLGYPKNKIPTPTQLEYMFKQADNRCADNVEFIFYCFNLRSRVTAASGTHMLWKTAPQQLTKLKQLVEDPQLMEDLINEGKRAEENPSAPLSDRGKDILSKFLPFVVAAGKRIPFGNCGNADLQYVLYIRNKKRTLSRAIHTPKS